MKLRVGVTVEGRRCGQDHPRASLTNAQVDKIRDWHESGLLGYREISKWCLREFGLKVPRSTVQSIVSCRRRYALAMKFKTVEVRIRRRIED